MSTRARRAWCSPRYESGGQDDRTEETPEMPDENEGFAAATDARGDVFPFASTTNTRRCTMQGRQEVVLGTLRQIQRFLEDNGALLDVVNQSGARKRLDQTVTQIGSHAVPGARGRHDDQAS